jgi:hypothetical protein
MRVFTVLFYFLHRNKMPKLNMHKVKEVKLKNKKQKQKNSRLRIFVFHELGRDTILGSFAYMFGFNWAKTHASGDKKHARIRF